MRTLALLLLLALPVGAEGVAPSASQMVLTITPDWNAITGHAALFERHDSGWERVGDWMPVTVGRSGLAWGFGLHGSQDREGPVKREGDGRAPAGTFVLSRRFGYPAPPGDDGGLPFLVVDGHECVDDAESEHYNCIVNPATVTKDWNSAETMKIDPYRLGIVVEHNTAPVVPGRGSCIFVHRWDGPEVPTAGCTALAKRDLEWLCSRLKRDAHPVLVQLPEPVYRTLREPWQLP